MISFKLDVESLKREPNRDLKRLSAKIPQAIARRGLNEGGGKVGTKSAARASAPDGAC